MTLVEAPPPPPRPPPSAAVVPHPLAIVDDDDAVSLVSAPDSVATAAPAVASQDTAADSAAATAAAAEAAFLSRLLSPTPVTSLTPDHLAAVRDGTLHATLPLVLAVLTRMGDTPGGRRPAVAAAAALRDRLSAGRALKLRFLLLIRTPGYARWHARLVYQPRCYEAAAAAAAAAAVARPSPSLASVACSAVSCGSAPPLADAAVDAAEGFSSSPLSSLARPPLWSVTAGRGGITSAADVAAADAATLAGFVRTELLHPRHGVGSRPRHPHHRRAVAPADVFVARDAVGWLVEHLVLPSRAEAVAVAERLRGAGLIRHASGGGRPFRDGGGVYVAAGAATVVASPSLTAAAPPSLSLRSGGHDSCLPLLPLLLSSSSSSSSPAAAPRSPAKRLTTRAARDAAMGSASLATACNPSRDGVPIELGEAAEATVASFHLTLGVDDVDLQGLDFWATDVFRSDVVAGHSFGHRQVVHPFPSYRASLVDEEIDGASSVSSAAGWSLPPSSSVAAAAADTGHDDEVVSQAVVTRVFSTMARPVIVELRRPHAGAVVGRTPDPSPCLTTVTAGDGDCGAGSLPGTPPCGGGGPASSLAYVGSRPASVCSTEPRATAPAAAATATSTATVGPAVLVKQGDNLLQDQAVEVMLRLFNHMWREAAADPAAAPYAPTYDVLPTGARAGLIEMMPGFTPLGAVDWDGWVARATADPGLVDTLVRSAAGAYVGTYVLGCRDRHFDNIGLLPDGSLTHIDFGFVVSQAPPMDGPRFSISPGLRGALRRVGGWDRFVAAAADAFTVLRGHAPLAVRAAVRVFGAAGFDAATVRAAVLGPWGLNVAAPSAAAAAAAVTAAVVSAAGVWRARAKGVAHVAVDPAFYGLLRLGFPPALLARRLVEARRAQPVVAPRHVEGERDACV